MSSLRVAIPALSLSLSLSLSLYLFSFSCQYFTLVRPVRCRNVAPDAQIDSTTRLRNRYQWCTCRARLCPASYTHSHTHGRKSVCLTSQVDWCLAIVLTTKTIRIAPHLPTDSISSILGGRPGRVSSEARGRVPLLSLLVAQGKLAPTSGSSQHFETSLSLSMSL